MPRRRNRTRKSTNNEQDYCLAIYANSIKLFGLTFSLNNELFKAENSSGNATKYDQFIQDCLNKYGTESFTLEGAEVSFKVLDPDSDEESTYTGLPEGDEA